MLYGKCVRRAAPSHDRHTGFADGRVGMRYPLPWFPLSDDTMRCIRRTIRDCRPSRIGKRLPEPCSRRRGRGYGLGVPIYRV